MPASKGGAPKSPAPPARRPAPSASGSQAPPGTPEPSGAPGSSGAAEPSGTAEPAEAAASRHRRELAALAWPEAAGTTPEQREALELAVRHQLPPDEVAAVLGLEPDAARALLSSAACEVERTRAALVVVERGKCPVVARLTGDSQVLLGAALRRELVRHVDDCPDCRRTAERATARGPWPGSTAEPGTLPVLQAPRAAAYAAMARTRRGGRAIGRTGPRFHRSGFPMDPKDRVARRRRMRSRAVTTAVVAAVVAAPVLALWAAYQQAPVTGEGRETGSVTAADAGPGGLSGHPYEEAGNAEAGPEPGFRTGGRSPDVSVEVVDKNGRRHSAGHRGRGTPTARASWSSLPSGTTRTGSGSLAPPGGPAAKGPGRLTVAAQPSGGTTLITMTASGGSPVRWSASADAPWLRLSLTAGLLHPGESVTITAVVDHDREPAGPWTARVSVAPAGAVVAIEGRGATPGPTTTPPPSEPSPTPTPPGPSAPEEPSGSSGTPSRSGSATAVPSE
ncbi:sigma-70 family RNA polymerase sigma factor [Streptomyces sp. NPDC001922]|uniref:BACON domain-containing protein n=1 Tax=Streptomyces sp. NPDC001922 TaxID=3364624 RepID=UPI00369D492B